MLLTNRERDFLAAFIHEATTDPFKGPATEELHRRDAYYTDLGHLLAAYYQETSSGQVGWRQSRGHATGLSMGGSRNRCA
jgi:hypothetical protein